MSWDTVKYDWLNLEITFSVFQTFFNIQTAVTSLQSLAPLQSELTQT